MESSAKASSEISNHSPSLERSRILAFTRKAERARLKEFLIEKFLLLNGIASIVIIALIFFFLFNEGVKAAMEIPWKDFIGHYGEDAITGQQVYKFMWQPVAEPEKYSLIPLILGSFLVAFPATLISTLFGIGIGIYLSEIAGIRVREIVKPFIELLAGIPTVVLGFFFLVVIASTLQNVLGTKFRLNAFVGALGVSLVIIPVIASMTEDALRAVPNDLREAAYGLGATRWQTISKAVLPAAVSGVAASVILGFGRALGETMIVLMATGNGAVATGNIFSTVRTMTATIAAELGEVVHGSPHYYALFLIGALLFTITFVFNLIAEIILRRMRKKLRM
ncbi:MAG: phosphate ABC transporter permease subunit PstC [Candidatus Latescibacteria bacterium]|nr:phosphate ABC transporter permease subunit PstC [Candidatus Latescibacterota bacterium]